MRWKVVSSAMGKDTLESEFLPDLIGAFAGFPKAFQCDGIVSFGESASGVVGQQLMVMVGRRGDSEERLQHAMQVGGVKKVDSADNFGDSLKSVVYHDGEVIACTDVFPDDHGIAQQFGFCLLSAVEGVLPGEGVPDSFQGFREVESEGVVFSGCYAGVLLVCAESSAGAGVEWAIAAVWSPACGFDFPQDVFSSAEAGVKEAA